MRGPEGKRKQRAVNLTDHEWERIGARANAAGMLVSRYIAHRLAGPAETPPTAVADPSPELLRRVLREVTVLSRIEQQRMASREDEKETWRKVAARVDAQLAEEEGLG
ncbi:MAG: hypothetical protein OXE57_00325 [Alphaproteobacteria bacterium]|nr:hypothetical protein [Alphaproteobacteria bacterium]